jgi:FAD/FMN-containing dehydrogenase
VLRASAEVERDLYWAVRGGTGNQFGVLVEIEYDLHELDTLFGFGLNWRLETAAEVETAARVLATYQAEFTKGASPEAMGLQALVMYLPTAEAPQGQVPQLLIRGVYDGTEAACRAALAPLIAPMADPDRQIEIWEEGRYLHLNEILLLTANPPGLDLPTVSMNTKPLVDGRIVHDLHGPEAWRRVLELFLRSPDKTNFLGIEAYGGAINARAPDFNAYVHRDDSVDLFAWAFWTFDAHERAARDWLAEFGEVAGAMSDGRRYQNYPLRGDHDFRRAYFGANLERLRAIKARVDPDDIFAFEQGIGAPPEKKSAVPA